MGPMRGLTSAILLAFILAAVGCQHVGPRTIADDRLAYNDAIATSWKEQILLNIVRIRYGDMVDFVDVGTITQNHSLTRETSGTFGATIGLLPFAGSNSLTPGWSQSRTATDSPNIVYTPLADANFTRNLLRPISPADICQLIEGGGSASAILDLALDSINNVHNRRMVIQGCNRRIEPEDRDWTLLIDAISSAHAQGDITFPIDAKDEKRVFMLIPERNETASTAVAEIRQALHLRSLQTKFEIKYGSYAWKNDEIIVRTRSVIHALRALAEYVQVPACHLAEGRARPLEGAGIDTEPLLRVNCSRKRPRDAFAAIPYQGYWFWVDQRDDGARSKESMIQMRTLMALADTGDHPPGPALVIPTK